MKKIGRKKIVLLAILTVFIVISAVVFLNLQSWLHSEGMHFIGGYGQVHLSHMCEGVDQDGNRIESRNVIVDGTITHIDKNGDAGTFDGEVNIDGLPELEKYGLFPGGGSGIMKRDNGLYCLFGYTFMASSSTIREKWDREEEWHELSFADIWCTADVWLKDNQFVMKFVQGETESEYYIFYSDKEMLNIPEIKERIS